MSLSDIFLCFFFMITLCPYLTISEDFDTKFLLSDYLSHLRIQWLTQDTIEFYLQVLERFIRFSEFKSHNDFNSFIKIKFAYYALSKRKIGNNTISKYYKCIKKYSEFLKENELVDKIYISQIQRVKVANPMPKALNEEDVRKMREQIMKMNPNNSFLQMRNYMIVETLIYTGIRRVELTQLKRKNIFDTYILIEQGKGQKDRIIYIPKSFSKQIKDWLEIQKRNNEYVFCGVWWGQLSRNAISCVFHRLEKVVWFKVHAHLLRHTYASICVKRGINLYTLQQQMGHTSLKTTSIYLYLNSKENHEEMQKLQI